MSVVLMGCDSESKNPSVDNSSIATASDDLAFEVLEVPIEGPVGFAPELGHGPDGVHLSWLEPVDAPDAVRLRWSRLEAEGWSPPQTIPVDGTLFANWADRPHVVSTGVEGHHVAHWLQKVGDGTYAYGIALGHSSDDRETWSPAGWLHDDLSPQEHGFATWVADENYLWAAWLDGRAMGDGAPMQLRALALNPRAPVGEGPELEGTVLDDRVCECCDTDSVLTPTGPVVVYRDRSETEVRNIALVRHTDDGWSKPAWVHDDGWVIPGCPVNGPAVASDGSQLAVAWTTLGTDQTPRVRLAFSSDDGAQFAPPIEIAKGESATTYPLGRVDLELDTTGRAWVLWLDQRSESVAEVRLRAATPEGTLGAPQILARTVPSRAAGVPRLTLDHQHSQGPRLIAAWIEATDSQTDDRRVRTAVIRLTRPDSKH